MIKTPPKKIVLASSNSGKCQEFKDFLSPFNCLILPQTELNIQSVDEVGLTFVENALLKARHAAACSKMPALADDSGLCVDVLKGEPGLYSARYAGLEASDQLNINKLMHQLKGVPESDRTAYFHCTLVYIRNETDPDPIICQGRWQGTIALEATGNNGFGYDPVFWVTGNQCSAAELDDSIKSMISHRAQAIEQFKKMFIF